MAWLKRKKKKETHKPGQRGRQNSQLDTTHSKIHVQWVVLVLASISLLSCLNWHNMTRYRSYIEGQCCHATWWCENPPWKSPSYQSKGTKASRVPTPPIDVPIEGRRMLRISWLRKGWQMFSLIFSVGFSTRRRKLSFPKRISSAPKVTIILNKYQSK